MRYLVLAADYDGTIASHGEVSASTLAALQRLRASGRKLVLVTGRHLPDLKSVFPHLELCQRVIAENGALLYRPETKEERLLGEAPSQAFLEALKNKGVPFVAGRAIVATWEPHQDAVLDTIRDLGLELQVIFNKGAVMVVSSGVNKASGLRAALEELGLSAHNVIAVGDAENDHALLAASECGVAVENALPFLKQRADLVMKNRNGAGVTELIDQILADDLASHDLELHRHSISLGLRLDQDGAEVRVSPARNSILVCGPSASGKSTAVAGILEQLAEQKYQFCLIDPEGDYENFAGALTLGSANERANPSAVAKALESPEQSIVVNLLGIPVSERPEYFAKLLPRIMDLRARTARPHWLVIDEAHHLLPSSWSPASTTLPQALLGTILITVHPDHVATAALNPVDIVIAVGKDPVDSFAEFAKALQIAAPQATNVQIETGEAMLWFRNEQRPLLHVRTLRAKEDRRRHIRQYAEGELSPEQSFYFRGPDFKLNLRAHNLATFLQLADGIDADTWNFHLRRGDYSQWFRDMVKDKELAEDAESIEQDTALSYEESRRRMRDAIQTRYTAPA
jgi:HAD superfamily hydrolase (TIGR01484 family)